MVYLLIASGVALLLGFYLGILVMALVKIPDSVPVPDARPGPSSEIAEAAVSGWHARGGMT
jgi:hypothetical protein